MSIRAIPHLPQHRSDYPIWVERYGGRRIPDDLNVFLIVNSWDLLHGLLVVKSYFWRRCEGGLGSERCGRQTNHDEFSHQIVNFAPHKILDNFYISRIYLVHVKKMN